jgi:hypothetical protein
MKTVSFNKAEETPTDLETVKMSIDSNSIDHLMLNLTNLYSDPVSAVVREYSTNAYDSHIRAGQSLPVSVSFPTLENPFFTVEDFGVGMSKQEIIDIYSKYGLSTKNNTNTEIGAFGLGAKSALAITDRFDITARQNGVETTAYIQKNSKGVGVVHFVSETETNQPNGFKISVPVKISDIQAFNNCRHFFDTWEPNVVIVDGEPVGGVQYTEEWLEINPHGGEPVAWVRTNSETVEPQIKRNYYGSAYGVKNNILFVIKGIPYPLPSSLFENLSEAKIIEKINRSLSYIISDGYSSRSGGYRVVFNLPVGSVDLTPNRESIMATDKTYTTVESVFNDIISTVPTIAQAELNKREMADALRFYANHYSFFHPDFEGFIAGSSSHYYGRYNRAFGLSKNCAEFTNVLWRGQKIPFYVSSNRNIFEMSSRSGVALKNWNAWTELPVLLTHNNKVFTFIVKTSDTSEATLKTIKTNLRDYAKKITGGIDVQVIVSDNKTLLSNEWVKATYSIISFDDFISKAREYRRVRKSEAQTGVERSKIGYAVINFKPAGGLVVANVDYVYSDVLPENGDNVVYVDVEALKNNSLASGAEVLGDTVEEVVRSKESSELKSSLNIYTGLKKIAKSGAKVVLLNKTKKPEAFVKKYPNSLSVSEAISQYLVNNVSTKQLKDVARVMSFILRENHSVSIDERMITLAHSLKDSINELSNPDIVKAIKIITESNSLYDYTMTVMLGHKSGSEIVDKLFAIAREMGIYNSVSLVAEAVPSRYSLRVSQDYIPQVIKLLNSV